jgi:hypothetical protein
MTVNVQSSQAVTTCRFVDGYQSLKGTRRLQHVPMEQYQLTKPDGATSQKTTISNSHHLLSSNKYFLFIIVRPSSIYGVPLNVKR